MAVQFYGRASDEDLEHVQEPFRKWLSHSLDEYMPDHGFIVVLRGYLFYETLMPRVRFMESPIVAEDVIVEVFAEGGCRGLCFALFLPKGVNRVEVIRHLYSCTGSFV